MLRGVAKEGSSSFSSGPVGHLSFAFGFVSLRGWLRAESGPEWPTRLSIRVSIRSSRKRCGKRYKTSKTRGGRGLGLWARAKASAEARARARAKAAPSAALRPAPRRCFQRRAQIDLSDALRRRLSVLSSELDRFVFAVCSGAVPNRIKSGGFQGALRSGGAALRPALSAAPRGGAKGSAQARARARAEARAKRWRRPALRRALRPALRRRRGRRCGPRAKRVLRST